MELWQLDQTLRRDAVGPRYSLHWEHQRVRRTSSLSLSALGLLEQGWEECSCCCHSVPQDCHPQLPYPCWGLQKGWHSGWQPAPHAPGCWSTISLCGVWGMQWALKRGVRLEEEWGWSLCLGALFSEARSTARCNSQHQHQPRQPLLGGRGRVGDAAVVTAIAAVAAAAAAAASWYTIDSII